MIFDIISFCKDYKIPYSTHGTQITSEWMGVDCPFCGKSEKGLGFNLKSGALSCWRCGPHGHIDLIKAFLKCDNGFAFQIRELYLTRSLRNYVSEDEKQRPLSCHLPKGVSDLNCKAKKYLESRKFDPEYLEDVWGLCSTDNVGDYKFRIIAPIMFNGKLVSYQGRDYTGKSDLKYKACKAENEVIPHQTIIYGMDHVLGDTCLIVEGIADVWRLGKGAVCCFGIAWTIAQVNLIASNFKTAYVLFDSEKEAQKQGYDLAILLNGRGIEANVLELESDSDPGDMSQTDADNLMTEIFG